VEVPAIVQHDDRLIYRFSLSRNGRISVNQFVVIRMLDNKARWPYARCRLPSSGFASAVLCDTCKPAQDCGRARPPVGLIVTSSPGAGRTLAD